MDRHTFRRFFAEIENQKLKKDHKDYLRKMKDKLKLVYDAEPADI